MKLRCYALIVVLFLGTFGALPAVGFNVDLASEFEIPTPFGSSIKPRFAHSVSVVGDTLAIGAPFDESCRDSADDRDTGCVYIYSRASSDSTTWKQVQKLSPTRNDTDRIAFYQFGWTVLLSNEHPTNGLLFVGSPWDNYDRTQGSVYVFQRLPSEPDGVKESSETILDPFKQIQKLSADSAYPARFGSSVSVSGTTLAVGGSIVNEGAVYIFDASENDLYWTQTQQLTPPDLSLTHWYGDQVSLYDNLLAVGAIGDTTLGSVSGAVFLYERAVHSSNWDLTQKLLGTGHSPGRAFGSSVAISLDGNTIAVGADGDDSMGTDAGAVYLFEKYKANAGNSSWIHSTELYPTATEAPQEIFGTSILFTDSNVLVVGAIQGRSYPDGPLPATFVGPGAVYIFENHPEKQEQGGWERIDRFTCMKGQDGDYFGVSVAVDGNTLVVGGDQFRTSMAGTAYAYRILTRNL